ncbi:MAG: PfkB family carbohydrate kinase [Solirubrobacteraceae bacterium]|jgi:ribokinase
MRVAVVGHVEWVEFAHVDRVPRSGEIVHALDAWEEAGGGGAVAAVQLVKLAGAADFFTALGDDELGQRSVAELTAKGVRLQVAWRPAPQRRAFTFTDRDGERTITVIGERLVPAGSDPLPWEEISGADAVYFTGGDPGALRAARAARVLVATSRARETLSRAGVALDALVMSESDAGERVNPGEIDPAPRLVVSTAGPRGGHYAGAEGRSGSFRAAPLPGAVVDSYGCGDSFAAGLTFGLASGGVEAALDLAARCGAACLTGRGPYAAQLRL